MKHSLREQKILNILLINPALASSGIHALMQKDGDMLTLVTIKRSLSGMVEAGLLNKKGRGPATTYDISMYGRVLADIDAHDYCSVDPDKRGGMAGYNFTLFSSFPASVLTPTEQRHIETVTEEYRKRTTKVPATIAKKELERLIIELSWKSSKIEGNTYTLLDTEKLLQDNQVAKGHDSLETQMILNHKDAFLFVREHARDFIKPSRITIEQLHSLLIKYMGVGTGLRNTSVGITGSAYRPLENMHHIREAIDALFMAISQLYSPFEKALLALLGISYIQPFEDGNKRTARLTANAILLAHDCPPLSYRSVDEEEYREAVLVFYEQNSIMPFKKIFLTQYEFSAKNYTIDRNEK